MTPYPGMDLSSLQALMQQFQPTEDDKRQARGMAALQAMAGLLGTRRGHEGQGIGQAIGGGLLGYQSSLADVGKQRMQGMQGAAAAMQLMSQKQALDDQQTMRTARTANFIPAQPGMQEMGPPTEQGGMQPAVAPTPESMNWQGYQSAIAGVNPQAAIQLDPFVRRQLMRDAAYKVGGGQQPPGQPQPPAGMPAGAQPGAGMPPQGGMGAPTATGSAMPTSAGMPPTGAAIAGKANATQQYIQQQQALISEYRKSGLYDEANSLQDNLIKMMPKSKAENKLGLDANGNLVVYSIDDQGGATPQNFKPAEKLHFGSNGQRSDIGFNEYTGAVASPGVPTMQDPNSKASNALGYANLAESKRYHNMELGIGEDGKPTNVDGVAKAIAAYDQPPLSSFAMAKPFGASIMSKVQEINPSYDAKNYATAQQTANAFSRGKQGDTVRSLNVVMQHTDVLKQASDALANGNIQLFNKIANAYGEQTGAAAPTNFNGVKEIVGNEIAKAVIGTGGGVSDRAKAQETISRASSPAQLAGIIESYNGLFAGQLSGLRQQYESGTQRQDFDKFLSPQAKALVQRQKTQAGAGDIRKRADEILNGNR